MASMYVCECRAKGKNVDEEALGACGDAIACSRKSMAMAEDHGGADIGRLWRKAALQLCVQAGCACLGWAGLVVAMDDDICRRRKTRLACFEDCRSESLALITEGPAAPGDGCISSESSPGAGTSCVDEVWTPAARHVRSCTGTASALRLGRCPISGAHHQLSRAFPRQWGPLFIATALSKQKHAHRGDQRMITTRATEADQAKHAIPIVSAIKAKPSAGPKVQHAGTTSAAGAMAVLSD